jgi:hypothetical protein
MNPETIRTLADLYAGHTGLTLSTVATYAIQNSRFFDRLEQGGSCTFKTAGRMVNWFSDNWPADLEWPRGIARPAATQVAA